MEHLRTYFNEVKEIVDKLDFDSIRRDFIRTVRSQR